LKQKIIHDMNSAVALRV